MLLLEPSVFVASLFLASWAIFNIDRYFTLRCANARNELINFKNTAGELRERVSKIDEKNLKLHQEVERIFSLYEFTKEVTKHLAEDELTGVFREIGHKYISFKDIRLIEQSQLNEEELSSYQKFSLKIKNEALGYLAVSGLGDTEKESFGILSSQFALALKRARLYKEIQKLAITDSLTAVYTRWYFLERAEEELHRSLKFELSFSFLMLDIDHFKDCNDKFGHLVGDAVLEELSEVLKGCIRQIDLLGRFGGEEFCILLPETNKKSAYQAAERIRQTVIDSEIRAYDEKIKLTVSIGIATFSEDADKLKELIDRSDWALYRAKQTGRNRICLYGVYK
ncbi:MAG: GGDEF domain-containing protein [Candidatus Omnitrophota bacterium]